MIKLSPSILAADFSILGEELKTIEDAGAQYVHIDVMDGCFVPNISIGPPVIKSLRKKSNLVFDVHLMIEEPERYIQDFYEVGADIINIHVETCKHLYATIQKIKSFNIKAAVTLNPSTPVNVLEYILPELDMILIMGVEPGFGGQKLIESTLIKLQFLSELIYKKGYNIDLEIDGGVTLDNLDRILKSGANIIVSGSAIFQPNKTAENVKRFLNIFNKYND